MFMKTYDEYTKIKAHQSMYLSSDLQQSAMAAFLLIAICVSSGFGVSAEK